ncbi:DUF3103 family protein [Streptosporangium sp. CA-135522]|uniref:DUF3103 family protein n=1 Tax=Streptosporangium sp. CA-135522 TaxID=3240072 RepID=UPI003D8CB344
MKKLIGLAAFTAMASAVLGGIPPVSAATPPTPAVEKPAAERAAGMEAYKRALAEQVARRLGDRGFRTEITRELADDGQADLAALFGAVSDGRELADYTRRANQDILRLKGIQAEGESLLQIRTDPAMARRVAAGEQALVMFTPSGDEKAVRTVTAYDSAGRTHQLDARRAPTRPVLIVGLDERRTAALSRQTIRRRLTEAGIGGTDRTLETGTQQASSSPAPLAATRPVSHLFRIVNRIDQEPWYKGGPEIYAWVMGAGLDGKARIDAVEMPYIQQEGKVYSPGQVLVEWSNFSWTAVDVVFMEHDDDTDLSGLVRAVVDGALVISGNGQYVQVADKVIGALPSDWTTDHDDWVDSCYLITAQTQGSDCAADPEAMSFVLAYHWV